MINFRFLGTATFFTIGFCGFGLCGGCLNATPPTDCGEVVFDLVGHSCPQSESIGGTDRVGNFWGVAQDATRSFAAGCIPFGRNAEFRASCIASEGHTGFGDIAFSGVKIIAVIHNRMVVGEGLGGHGWFPSWGDGHTMPSRLGLSIADIIDSSPNDSDAVCGSADEVPNTSISGQPSIESIDGKAPEHHKVSP